MADEPDITGVPFGLPNLAPADWGQTGQSAADAMQVLKSADEGTELDGRINIHLNTPPVRGYRDLTQAEVDLINEIKAKGDELGELIATVRAIEGYDEHCTNLAEDQLKIGTMLLVRAVARPTGF